jgi:hypothetical protein
MNQICPVCLGYCGVYKYNKSLVQCPTCAFTYDPNKYEEAKKLGNSYFTKDFDLYSNKCVIPEYAFKCANCTCEDKE